MNIQILQKHPIGHFFPTSCYQSFLHTMNGSIPSNNTSGNRSAIKGLEKKAPPLDERTIAMLEDIRKNK